MHSHIIGHIVDNFKAEMHIKTRIFSTKEEVGREEMRGSLHKDFGAVKTGLLDKNTQKDDSLAVSGHENSGQGQSTKCKEPQQCLYFLYVISMDIDPHFLENSNSNSNSNSTSWLLQFSLLLYQRVERERERERERARL